MKNLKCYKLLAFRYKKSIAINSNYMYVTYCLSVELGMFNRAFNGGHICRFCTIHYRELDTCDGFIRHKLWDEELYDGIAEALENGDDVENFSLRGNCVLNELQSFHAASSMAPDLLHDFLEGKKHLVL
jgi:hypothetical protein